MIKRILLGLCLFVAITSMEVRSEAENQLSLGLFNNQFNILFVDDTDNLLEIDQIKRLSLDTFASKANLNYEPDSFDFSVWYRLTLKSTNNIVNQPLSVLIDNATLNNIDFYLIRDGQVIATKKLGDLAKHNNRLDFMIPQFQFVNGIQATDILFINIKNQGAIATPIVIESIQDSHLRSSAQITLLGVFFGVALIMIVYNLFMFRGTADPSYLHYICYVFFAGLTISVINGFLFFVLPSNFSLWLHQHVLMPHFASSAFGVLFAISFLRTSSMNIWTVKFGYLFSKVLFGLALLALALPESTMLPYYMGSMIFTYLYIFSLLFSSFRRQEIWVRYYLISWLPLLAGVGIGLGTWNGAVGYSFLTRNAGAIGVLAEIFLMALALMDRFRASENIKQFRKQHDMETNAPNRVFLYKALQKLADKNIPFDLAVFELKQVKEIIPYLDKAEAERYFVNVIINMENVLSSMRGIYTFEQSNQGKNVHVARYSESKLAIIIIGDLPKQTLSNKIAVIQSAISAPVDIDDVTLFTSSQAAVVAFPADCHDLQHIFNYANQALLDNKINHSHWSKYSPNRSKEMKHRFKMIASLQQAINDDDLELYHQPIVNVAKGEICCSEILLRWQHPEFGQVKPQELIEIAEGTGVMTLLTQWIFNRAFEQHAKLTELGFKHDLAINLSRHDVTSMELLSIVKEVAEKHQINPSSVTFEISELTINAEPSLSKSTLTELANMGYQIAIDDFGDAPTSLNFLMDLPIAQVKVNQQAVSSMPTEKAQKLTEVALLLTEHLGVNFVAKGVETEEAVRQVRTMGGNIVQGFFYSKPLSYIEYMRWLQSNLRHDLPKPIKVG